MIDSIEKIQKKEAREIINEFYEGRIAAEDKNKKHYSKWIEEQASSRITKEEFVKLIEDLEDAKKLSREKARELHKEFKTLRKAAIEAMNKYDS